MEDTGINHTLGGTWGAVDAVRAAPALLWRSEGALARVFSERWLAFTGLALDAADGDGWLAAVHPDDLKLLRSVIIDAEQSVHPYQHQYRLRRADGVYRWILEQGDPVILGERVLFEGCCMDITARRERDMATTYSERGPVARFGHLLDRSPNEIYIFDAETLHFVQANQGALRNLGYDIEDLRTMTPLDVKPELTAEQFHELVEPLRVGRVDQVNFETVHQRKNGSRYPVEVRLSYAGDETPSVFVAVVEDTTQRRRMQVAMETALAAREQAVQEIAERREELDDLVQNILASFGRRAGGSARRNTR